VTQGDDLERGIHRLGADVPLSAGAGLGLLEVVACEHTERDRDIQACSKIRQSARHGLREHVEVRRLSADQTAKRHDGIEPTGRGNRSDRRRKLEGAGDLEFLDFRSSCECPRDRPLREAARDPIVPAGPDDRHPGTDKPVSHSGGRLPTPRHLAQSSPRMTPLWAAR
jgi:hypothetical protein